MDNENYSFSIDFHSAIPTLKDAGPGLFKQPGVEW